MDEQLLMKDIEEEAAVDPQERLKQPLIIAMKGLPFTGKNSIGRTFAGYLRCPLISRRDLHHFAAALQHKADDLSFKAICRIASTQLDFNARVIIDSDLSSPARLDQLVRLAASKGARLVIIECRPGDRYEWKRRLENDESVANGSSHKTYTWEDLEEMLHKYEEYDVGHVPKLIVDTTKLFDLESLVSATLGLAFYRNPHCLQLDQWENAISKWTRFRRPSSKTPIENVPTSCRVHSHTFSLCNFQIDHKKNGICNLCNNPVSGPAYDCHECNFVLHKSCAELPKKAENLCEFCPVYLKTTTPDYSSLPEKQACDACRASNKEFSDHCSMCLSMTLLKSKLLPSIYHHESHKHPLKCNIRPLNSDFKSEFECSACGNLGVGMSYSCGSCKFHLHLNCLLLPRVLKHQSHRDFLTLNHFPPVDDDSKEYYCDACETERNPHHWVYYCQDHQFAAHLSCLTSEVSPYETINCHTYFGRLLLQGRVGMFN